MIVLYWMTPDPVTVTAEDSLFDVWQLLRAHAIRRVPVVEDEDRLVGLIGRADLYRFASRAQVRGPAAGVRDSLEPIRVGDVMSQDPTTCEVNDHLEVVSEKMRKLKIGAFPVLSRGHLVGIISETDLLRALGELAGVDSGAERITVRVPTSQDGERTCEIVDLCRRYSLELTAVLTHQILEDSATMTTLRVREQQSSAEGENAGKKVDEFVQALWKAGFNVVDRS